MPLYIFSDAGRTTEEQTRVAEVRTLLGGVKGFGDVRSVFRERNFGCAKNIIDGVSQVLLDYDSVIVIEDDLLLSPHFLHYVRSALARYRAREDIFSISGFSVSPSTLGIRDYPGDVYLSRRNYSCGWATWRDRWARVDWAVSDYDAFRLDHAARRRFDLGGDDMSRMLDDQIAGRIDSWAIRFSYAHYLRNAWSVCPLYSFVQHVGDDGSGTHARLGDTVKVDLQEAKPRLYLAEDVSPDPRVLQALRKWHSEHWISRALGRVPGVRHVVRGVKSTLGIRGRLLP
jgi:hypothetical protein